MKKLILFFSLFLAAYGVQAQEANEGPKFDKWSIEVSGGLNKPVRHFTSGYYSATPSPWNVDLGVRYMFNNKFGLKLDGGYYNLESADDSRDFESKYYRASLQGVVNAGNLLGFKEWTNTFGLLVHAGAGVSMLDRDDAAKYSSGDDWMGHVIVGVTPQIRLSNTIALTGDFSAIGNVRQSVTWDGNSKVHASGFDGFLTQGSIGITFYLGSAEKHADWVGEQSSINEKFEEVENRLSKIENDMLDTDQDGVPDYLDREPNTTNGVAVDTKGRAIDKNGNGIPDELEGSLDNRYAKVGDVINNTNGSNAIKDLINKGYVNVYFKFDSTQPETYSLEAINYLVKYMQENSSAKAELIGYTDEIGNANYNLSLSEKRAKKVYDILVAAGVDSSRLEHKGGGVDSSVKKSSKEARQLVRRVTFKLK